MKNLFKFLPVLLLTGCMMPNINRLIPENKDFHGFIYSPVYGYAVLDTRVVGSTNALPPLPVPVQTPQPPPITIQQDPVPMNLRGDSGPAGWYLVPPGGYMVVTNLLKINLNTK